MLLRHAAEFGFGLRQLLIWLGAVKVYEAWNMQLGWGLYKSRK